MYVAIKTVTVMCLTCYCQAHYFAFAVVWGLWAYVLDCIFNSVYLFTFPSPLWFGQNPLCSWRKNKLLCLNGRKMVPGRNCNKDLMVKRLQLLKDPNLAWTWQARLMLNQKESSSPCRPINQGKGNANSHH